MKQVLMIVVLSLLGCGGKEGTYKPTDETLNKHLIKITHDKKGLEIGGPSPATARLIYEHVSSLDNLVSSRSTVWAKHADTYRFSENKSGNVLINDATALTSV